MPRNFHPFTDFESNKVVFALGQERQGKPTVVMVYGEHSTEVAIVTPACITNWPRCTGDGNFGTMWGPTDPMKTKFTLDLNDTPINGEDNVLFHKFATLISSIDDRLLDFVFANQLKLLGRKNLSREEVKMLQIRSVRNKIDKMTGADNGEHLQLSAAKYVWDGMGGKMTKPINVCDRAGSVIPDAVIAPGDVVAATMFANQIYTGVGGDKFGIHWSFEDVAIVCQRSKLERRTEVSAFQGMDGLYAYAQEYSCGSAQLDASAQFETPVCGA